MLFEGLLVVLSCFEFWVERSKVSRVLYQAVAGPLVPNLGEECVSKVILVVRVTGGAVTNTKGGRTTPQKKKQKRESFDPTRGFPGEDIQNWVIIFC